MAHHLVSGVVRCDQFEVEVPNKLVRAHRNPLGEAHRRICDSNLLSIRHVLLEETRGHLEKGLDDVQLQIPNKELEAEVRLINDIADACGCAIARGLANALTIEIAYA